MKFTWMPEEQGMMGYEMELPMGACVRGLHRKNVRPMTCAISPAEMLKFMQDHKPAVVRDYLHRVNCTLAI